MIRPYAEVADLVKHDHRVGGAVIPDHATGSEAEFDPGLPPRPLVPARGWRR